MHAPHSSYMCMCLFVLYVCLLLQRVEVLRASVAGGKLLLLLLLLLLPDRRTLAQPREQSDANMHNTTVSRTREQ